MKSQYFSAPRDDRWFFKFIATSLANRLANLHMCVDEYHGIAQLLYAIQEFPRIRMGLAIQVMWQTGYQNWGDDNGCPPTESNLAIEYSYTSLCFVKDDVRLEYRRRSNKLLAHGHCLTGEARRTFLNVWVEEFADLSDPDITLIVERCSEELEGAGPPLSEFWNENVRITENPFD